MTIIHRALQLVVMLTETAFLLLAVNTEGRLLSVPRMLTPLAPHVDTVGSLCYAQNLSPFFCEEEFTSLLHPPTGSHSCSSHSPCSEVCAAHRIRPCADTPAG
mmetsp:Transcript_34641/g.56533  ORF Transcript_34641/g.56533 Transcript_34641/m.56533 type:complete len:103 (+) Transcript_34641:133-441(+)